jgi:hypothetical protein
LSNGTKGKISSFFEEFQQLLQSFPPEFVFGADETMINMNKAHKAIQGECMAISAEPLENQGAHISVIVIHSAAGGHGSTVCYFATIAKADGRRPHHYGKFQGMGWINREGIADSSVFFSMDSKRDNKKVNFS